MKRLLLFLPLALLMACSHSKPLVNPWQITLLGSLGQNFEQYSPLVQDYPLVLMTFRVTSTAQEGKLDLERLVFRYDTVTKVFKIREVHSFWSMGRKEIEWIEEGEGDTIIPSSVFWLEEVKVLLLVVPDKDMDRLANEIRKTDGGNRRILPIAQEDLIRFLIAIESSQEASLTFVGGNRNEVMEIDAEHKNIARFTARTLAGI